MNHNYLITDMKILKSFVLALLGLALFIVSSCVSKPEASLLLIGKELIAITPQSNYQINPKVYPEEFKVTFKSSNPAVAIVDEKGLVSAVSEGDAVINVSAGNVTVPLAVKVRSSFLLINGELYEDYRIANSSIDNDNRDIAIYYEKGVVQLQFPMGETGVELDLTEPDPCDPQWASCYKLYLGLNDGTILNDYIDLYWADGFLAESGTLFIQDDINAKHFKACCKDLIAVNDYGNYEVSFAVEGDYHIAPSSEISDIDGVTEMAGCTRYVDCDFPVYLLKGGRYVPELKLSGDLENFPIIFLSRDPEVAVVNNKGVVTAVAPGETEIRMIGCWSNWIYKVIVVDSNMMIVGDEQPCPVMGAAITAVEPDKYGQCLVLTGWKEDFKEDLTDVTIPSGGRYIAVDMPFDTMGRDCFPGSADLSSSKWSYLATIGAPGYTLRYWTGLELTEYNSGYLYFGKEEDISFFMNTLTNDGKRLTVCYQGSPVEVDHYFITVTPSGTTPNKPYTTSRKAHSEFVPFGHPKAKLNVR